MWPHQQLALEKMESVSRGVIQSFCGTGKTQIIFERLKRCKGHRGVVFPSLSSLEQFQTVYGRYLPITLVCSDDSGESDLVYSLKRCQSLSFSVTYASLPRLVNALVRTKTKLEVLLFDEAHYICRNSVQRTVFEHDVAEQMFFFTATPENKNGVLMDKELPHTEKTYSCGETLIKFTHRDAVEKGICNDFELLVDFGTAQMHLYLALARGMIQTGNNRFLSFHEGPLKEELFRQACVSVARVEKKECMYTNLEHFRLMQFSRMSLHQFNSTPDIDKGKCDNWLVVIDTVPEGVDINCSGIMFADPKPRKIIQNIGRCCRKQSVRPATIVIPVYVTSSSSQHDSRDFEMILNVYAALQRSDPEYYQKGVLLSPNSSSGKKRHTVHVNMEADLALLWQVVGKPQRNFVKGCDRYLAFYRTHGRAPDRPCSADPEERSLTAWVQFQRRKFATKRSFERNRLNDLPKWKWQKTDDFAEWCEKYQLFWDAHQRLPYEWAADTDEKRLAVWVKRQRRLAGKQRRKTLLALPGWLLENANLKERCRLFTEFVEDHHRLPQSPSADATETHLESWMRTLREKKREGRLARHLEILVSRLPRWKWDKNQDETLRRQKILARKREEIASVLQNLPTEAG